MRICYFRAANFRAVKQFLYSRTNNSCALTNLIFSRRSKLWLKMFSKALREICRNKGFLRSIFYCIWTESYPYFPILDRISILFKYRKIQIRFCPRMRKYGSEKVILVYTEILVNQRYWFIQRRWISSKAEKIKKDI